MKSLNRVTFRAALAGVLAGGLLVCSVPAAAQTVPPPPPAKPPAAAPAQTPAAAAPLPTGARIAFVNLQVVFSESNLGKAGQDRWRVLNDKLFANLSARNKEIQGLSEKIKAQQSVAGEDVLRSWNQDLARLQRQEQFARQEAQVQSDQLQRGARRVRQEINPSSTRCGRLAIVGVQSEPGGWHCCRVSPAWICRRN
jgi:Skp family chaperone for outer membrane proteins